MNIKDMAKEAFETARSKGFSTNYDTNPDLVYKALVLIHGELTEAANEYIANGTSSYIKGEKPEGFAIELADVVLRISALCEGLNIDLQEAILKKMAFNQTRPWRHGKPGTGVG